MFLKKQFNFFENGKIIYFLFISIAFSYLALTTGLLTGTSKSPVVGVIIPSILTFYAGLMTYLFVFSNKENKIENSISVGVSILSMSLSLIVGADYGADMREKSEDIEIENTFRRDLERMDMEYKIKRNELKFESINSDQSKDTMTTDRNRMKTR